ncbi:hypothetical protein HMPREF9057_01407 [Actinomyces sp. oral taxon 171 str. F0337]|nr:hypothetical protein HMPREF9057_01407 [Actinomyces sp. oral taxon 171 str. F0337]
MPAPSRYGPGLHRVGIVSTLCQVRIDNCPSSPGRCRMMSA